jgi:hypothetical protein
MDIRTKLIFALVSATLASMFVLGLFAVRATTEIVQQSSARRLEALAESKQRDLEKVVAGWQDRIRLVSSRTQLRDSLRSYGRDRDPGELERVELILHDALGAVADLRRITVFDSDGHPVATQGESTIRVSETLVLPDEIELGETLPNHGDVEVALRAPLLMDGQKIGALEVVQGVDEIEHVTADYTGLEETGEAYVVMRIAGGDVAFLNGVRHNGGVARRIASADVAAHIEAALAGDETLFLGETEDYRHEPVWAATRTLPATGWGLVVKIDTAEMRQKTEELRSTLRDLSFSLAAFAILGGTLLGLYLAKPIRDLADVVGRIRDGEVDLRADTSGEDEVGFLGRAINELLDDRKRGAALPTRRDRD